MSLLQDMVRSFGNSRVGDLKHTIVINSKIWKPTWAFTDTLKIKFVHSVHSSIKLSYLYLCHSFHLVIHLWAARTRHPLSLSSHSSVFPLIFSSLALPRCLWDHSPLTRDWTHAPCNGSAESQPLHHQGSLSTD